MSRHVIEEATFDVSFDDTRTALAQEPGLPAFVRDRLMPLADEIFCNISGEESVLQLERLEIDLGDIAYDGFQGEMERRFKTMLTAALHDRKHELVALPPSDRGKKEADSAAFAQLKHFFETGRLEWNAEQENTATIDQLLRDAIRNAGPALLAFLKNTPYRDVAVKRLSRQFPTPLLREFMEMISSGDGIRLERLMDAFVLGRQGGASSALSGDEIRSVLWEQLFRAYLEPGADSVDPERLFQEITKDLPLQPGQAQADGEGSSAIIGAGDGQAPIEAAVQRHEVAGGTDDPYAASGDVGTLPAPTKENEPYRHIVQRLLGQSGPDLTMYIAAVMRAAPASLGRLLRQLQSGAIRGSVDFLQATEARQLLRAFIQIRQGKPGGAFIGAIEARAALARNTAHYYRSILRQLLQEQEVDLEAAAAAVPAQAADVADLADAVVVAAQSGDNHPGHGAAMPRTQSAISSRLPALLDRALTEGHADVLAGAWEVLHEQHPDMIRAAFARHMGDQGMVGRVAAGFPEALLLQLADVAGGLVESENALLEALSRHPALRREAAAERNASFWTYTLGYLHTHGAGSFALAEYLRGLSKHLPNDGDGLEPLLHALRGINDAGDISDLHDHLLAASWAKIPHEAGRQKREIEDAAAILPRGRAESAASASETKVHVDKAFSGGGGQGAATNQVTPAASSADNDAVTVEELLRSILQRLQGQPGPGMAQLTHLIETVAQNSPAGLDRLFRQLQTGETAASLALLNAPEARQLLLAFIKVRHGVQGGAFVRSIETQATQAKDAAHYYRTILRQLLQEQDVDLEAAASASPAPTPITAPASIAAKADSAHGGDDAFAEIPDVAQPSAPGLAHFPALLDQALKEGNAGKLAGMWEELRYGHANLLHSAFARHMGDENRVARVAAGFPETLLLELAAAAGGLGEIESALIEALSRHPALRRETAQESNAEYWVYTLRNIHALGGQPFDLAGYIRNLLQHLPEDGIDADSLLQALRQITDLDALYDHLLARASAKTSPHASHHAAADVPHNAQPLQEAKPAAGRQVADAAAISTISTIPAIGEAAAAGNAETGELLVERLQGASGPDLAEAIATTMRTSPASLERLFQQLQAGEIQGDVQFLSLAETRQLLQAFVHLRLGEKGAKLLLSIEARSNQAEDAGRHYRHMLKQLLQKRGRSDEEPAPSRVQDLVPAPTAREEEAYRDIVQRLQGQSAQDVCNMIEALGSTSPASVERLLGQLRSGEIRGQLGHLHAEDVRQLLFAFIGLSTRRNAARDTGLNTGPNAGAIGEPAHRLSPAKSMRSIEAQSLQAGDLAGYYRHLLEQFLRDDNQELNIASALAAGNLPATKPGPGTGTEASISARDQAAAIAAGDVFSGEALQQQLARRLQGQTGPSLADAIETLGRRVPANLEDVFQRLQRLSPEGMRREIGYFDADEARQTIFALVRLRHGVLDADFVRQVDTQAIQAKGLAQYYRALLGQLLAGESADFKTTLAKVAGNATDSATAADAKSEQDRATDISASRVSPGDDAQRQLVRRLQGQPGPSLSNLISKLERTTPALLENLLRQLQSGAEFGAIKADVAFLDAAEAQQLLHAFVRLRMGNKDGSLLRAIEARAARAPDRAHHYRALLKQFLQKREAELTAMPMPGPTPVRNEYEAGNAPNASKEITNADGATGALSKAGPRSDAATGTLPTVMPEASGTSGQAPFAVAAPPNATIMRRDGGDGGTRQVLPPEGNRAQAAEGPGAVDKNAHAQHDRQDQIPPSSRANLASDGSDVSYRYIVRRLQGHPGPDVASMIETMKPATPGSISSLERLFGQMQGGELRGSAAYLNANEAGGLLRAFVMLRLKENGGQFFQAVAAYASQAKDIAHYYRYLLERLLREENLDLELAAAGLTSDEQRAGSNSGPNMAAANTASPDAGRAKSADGHIGAPADASIQAEKAHRQPTEEDALRRGADAAHPDTPYAELAQRLSQRLLGQAGPDLADAIEAAAQRGAGNAADLVRLVQQWENGGIKGDVAYLNAAEAKQLLRVVVQSSHGERAEGLLKSIEARARLARDVARYYRYLLKQAIESGLDAGVAIGPDDVEHPPSAPRNMPYPAAASPAAAITSQSDKRLAAQGDNFMAANAKPGRRKQAENEQEAAAPAKMQTNMLVANAGLVLAAPYLPHLFKMLELTDGSKFKDERAAERAIHLAQFAVDQRCDTPEFQLVLNKILCGVAIAAPIAREIRPLAKETEAVDSMLQAMIQHWSIIGNTSLQGLRETFLQRAGMLQWREDGWRLKVERKTLDVLVDRLPWSFSIIKYPWMAQPIHVEWN